LPNLNESIRLSVWQRPQKQRIDDAENRRVRADAQRQRQDCNQGKERVIDKHPRAIAEDLPKCFKPPATAHIVTLFSKPRHIAESTLSSPLSFIGRHSSPDVLRYAHVDVELQLIY